MPGLGTLTALATLTTAAATISSSSSSSTSSSSASTLGVCGVSVGDPITWCRNRTYTDLYNELEKVFNASDDTIGCSIDEAILYNCDPVCPSPSSGDFKLECSTHSFHPYYSVWQDALTAQPGLQWNIFFVAFCLLLGAAFKKLLPHEVPYTVGILVTFFCLGLAAQSLVEQTSCPVHAWVYATDHAYGHSTIEGVSRAEWDNFIGVGFDPDAFCIVGEGGSGNKRRSCGDGSADPPECRYSFSDLDAPFKLTQMLVEQVANEADGYLSADELWTPHCNLLRDMLGLSDIDPHQLLVIFLPALLFESACFGIDMGLFNKQRFQIIILAFPAMILASALTGLLVWACFPNWTFWVCWLIGIIQSATDPVAVVALLKELGASKARPPPPPPPLPTSPPFRRRRCPHRCVRPAPSPRQASSLARAPAPLCPPSHPPSLASHPPSPLAPPSPSRRRSARSSRASRCSTTAAPSCYSRGCATSSATRTPPTRRRGCCSTASACRIVQSGRPGGATAGHHGLYRLHLRARGCSPHSRGEAHHLRPHREAVALEPRRTKLTDLAASDDRTTHHTTQVRALRGRGWVGARARRRADARVRPRLRRPVRLGHHHDVALRLQPGARAPRRRCRHTPHARPPSDLPRLHTPHTALRWPHAPPSFCSPSPSPLTPSPR